MASPLRFQYPGAVYHVMARGDGGKVVFETDDDRLVFLKRLEETCGSCGWRVHAWVLMGNHFHLLLETLSASFYRTARDAEIDLVLEMGGKHGIWAVEIKHSSSASLQKGNRIALDDIQPSKAFLVHSGTD